MAKQSARVLGRMGARELTMEEVEKISGGAFTQTFRITHIENRFDTAPDFDA